MIGLFRHITLSGRLFQPANTDDKKRRIKKSAVNKSKIAIVVMSCRAF